MESSICRVSFGSLMASRRREPTLMSIIVMLWLRSCTVGSNFGSRKPGVARKRCVSSKICMARSAQCLSPVAMLYSLMAMAAKVSENT